ncbi:MAG: hypothetical protein CL840_00245 [Crocinitomicaceae bacterium]|nr:hypothetical protein [Crocinitomicaceae bacterium]|tara:strand:+ start:11687 stop:12934 length:1248 start_codon:yes stop_codon:yes gene_type:complete
MNRLIYIALIGVLGSASLFGQAQEKTPKPELDGFMRNYTGVLYETGDFSIVQNTLDITLKHKRKNISFLANGFYYQYFNQKDYFDFRELYMDVHSKKVDVRIGRQQIVWGQADGVFITDIVSPLNLTEFLLWDFNEIRMGVNAVKFKYYPTQDQTFELVWIPIFTPSIVPSGNSIWKPQRDFPAPPSFDSSKIAVPSNIENSEFFARYSLSKSAFDLQLIGTYTWEDLPSISVQKNVDTNMALTGITITPEHKRLCMAGGNVSADLLGFIARGEVAYYHGKQFQTADPMDSDALIQKDYLNYVVGLDKSMGTWKLSGQFIQKVIFDYNENILEDEIGNLMTVMVNKSMFREQVRLELFSYIGLTDEDALVRIRGYYFPYDGISIELGTNLFLGDKGTFGQYHNNSMIYTRIKYSF